MTKVKEEYPTISLVLDQIKYMEHKWVLCVDIKMFSKLSNEKLKAGIFDGPQIRKLINDKNCIIYTTVSKKCTWEEFVLVVKHFLGNRKSDGYVQHVEQLVMHWQRFGCNMSIKLHYLHSHLDRFPENLGDLSKEHGELFHQNICTMEERYQGYWYTKMMADYCWSIQTSTPNKKIIQKKISLKLDIFNKFLYLQVSAFLAKTLFTPYL